MRHQLKGYLLALTFLMATAAQTIGQEPDNLVTLDVPGATLTTAQGINARGDIVGQYTSGE